MRFRWFKGPPEEKDESSPFQLPDPAPMEEAPSMDLPGSDIANYDFQIANLPPDIVASDEREMAAGDVFGTAHLAPDVAEPESEIPHLPPAAAPDKPGEVERQALPGEPTGPKRDHQWVKNLTFGRLLRWGLFIFVLLWLFRNCHSDIPLEQLKQRYVFPDSRFVPVCGMDVHCRISGKGEALLLLHDSYSSMRTWNAWHEGLSKKYQVISVDLPGFGLTGPHPMGSYSAFMYKGFVDSLAQALGLKQFNLAGSGLGAQIAWFYASEFPKKLRHLILIDAAGFEKTDPDTWINWVAKTPVLNRTLQHITPVEYVRLMLEDVYADDNAVTDSLVKEHFELLLRPGNRKAMLDRALVKDNWPPVAVIDTIGIPTLILWGAEDARISPKYAYNFHGKIRTSALRIYQHTGHWPQQENPAQTVKDVALFLEGKF